MTFARGATLTTATTLGHSDTSNLGPTAGNGFYKRWPDDLALLQELGLTDIRLTLDWARLQPKPGVFDAAWVERFEQMTAAANAIGLRLWATLHDGAEPRWVSNEGGIGNDDVATKWWPRYVERVADKFGDTVHGWIPFSGLDDDTTLEAWTNTWAIVGGGEAPVVAAISDERIDQIPDYLESCDRIGLVMVHGELPTSAPSDERLELLRERLHATLMRTAELAGDTALVISQFTPHHDDAVVAGQIVEHFVAALDAAIDDGADIDVAFLDPAIAGPYSPNGLLDADRAPEPAAGAFLLPGDPTD